MKIHEGSEAGKALLLWLRQFRDKNPESPTGFQPLHLYLVAVGFSPEGAKERSRNLRMWLVLEGVLKDQPSLCKGRYFDDFLSILEEVHS